MVSVQTVGRKSLRVLLFTLTGLALLVSILLLVRLPLLNALLPHLLQQQGLPPLPVQITQLDLNRLVVGPTRSQDGTLAWQRIELLYTPSLLLHGTLTALRLEGLQITLQQDAQGAIQWPMAQNQAPAQPSRAEPFQLPTLPIDHVEIVHSQLQLNTPTGLLSAQLQGQLEHRLDHLHTLLQLSLPGLDMTLKGALSLFPPYGVELQSDLKLDHFQPPLLPIPYAGSQLTGLAGLRLDGPLQALLEGSQWPRLQAQHQLRIAHAHHPGHLLLKGQSRLQGGPQGNLTLSGTLAGAALQAWTTNLPLPPQSQIKGYSAYHLTASVEDWLKQGVVRQGWSRFGLQLNHPHQGEIALTGELTQPAGSDAFKLHGQWAFNRLRGWQTLFQQPAATQLDGTMRYAVGGKFPLHAAWRPTLTLYPEFQLTALQPGAATGNLTATLTAQPEPQGMGLTLHPDTQVTLQHPLPPSLQTWAKSLGSDGRWVRIQAQLPQPLQLHWNGHQGLHLEGALQSNLALSAGGQLHATLSGSAQTQLDQPTQQLRFNLEQLEVQLKQLEWHALQINKLQLHGHGAGRLADYQGELQLESHLDGTLPGGSRLKQGRVAFKLPFSGGEDHLHAALSHCMSLEYATFTPSAGLVLEGQQSPLCIHAPKLHFNWQQPTQPRLDLELIFPEHRTDLLIQQEKTPQLVQIRTPHMTLALTGSPTQWHASSTLLGGRFKHKGQDLLVRDLDLQLQASADKGKITAHGTIAKVILRPMAATGQIAPFQYQGKLLVQNDHLTLDGRLADLKGILNWDLRVNHSLPTGVGNAALVMTPLLLRAQGIQPKDLLRMLKGKLEGVEGEVSLQSHLNWGAAERSDLTLRLHGVGMQTRPARLEGLDLTLELASLRPPKSRQPHRLHIDLLDVGLPVRNIEAELLLRPDGVLVISWLKIPFANGWIKANHATFNLKDAHHELLLEVENVDLAEMAKLVKLPGFTATGQLYGRMPVKMVGGRLLLDHATLFTHGGGIIANQTLSAEALKAGGEQPSIVAKAMENLHYKQLTVTMDGDLAGALQVKVAAEGKNPDLYQGHALILNLSVEGALGDLFNREMEGFDIPAMLKREGILQ
ncbi:YdbH domain-containing protein [Magnetococcus marinus]|nr:YdbH domain-containing protein [Magnetococcus marinus]